MSDPILYEQTIRELKAKLQAAEHILESWRKVFGEECLIDGFRKTQERAEKAEKERDDLSIKLQRTVSAAFHALLETTAWLGIPEAKRDAHIEEAMSNVKYCAEHDLRTQDESERNNLLKSKLQRAREGLRSVVEDGSRPIEMGGYFVGEDIFNEARQILTEIEEK